MLENQRRLVIYNGQISSSFAHLDASRITRDVRAGFATSATTEFLSRAINRLEEALQPFRNARTNAMNLIGGSVVEGLATGVTAANEMSESFMKWMEKNPSFKAFSLANELIQWINRQDSNFGNKGMAPPVLNEMYRLLERENAPQNNNVPKVPRKAKGGGP